jgi:intraflagellar transport protein 88
LLGDATQSTEWFLQLLGIVPSDANILQRLGQMHDAEGDKSQAFQYYYDVRSYDLHFAVDVIAVGIVLYINIHT